MRRWVFLLLTVAASLASACATTKSEDKVSSIPWNRPQQWEGQGALGGFHQPGGTGY
jgi:hypothetical protein